MRSCALQCLKQFCKANPEQEEKQTETLIYLRETVPAVVSYLLMARQRAVESGLSEREVSDVQEAMDIIASVVGLVGEFQSKYIWGLREPGKIQTVNICLYPSL